MPKWFAKDNIHQIYCSDTSEKIDLDIKYSDNVPSTEKHFINKPNIQNPRDYKIYDSYERVKIHYKKKRSDTKILEIMKYFNIIPVKTLGINYGKGNIITVDRSGISNIVKTDNKEYDFIVAYGTLKNEDSNVDEEYVFPLLLHETMVALRYQQQNGTFILRFYNSTTKPTIQLIYLLTNMYKNISIMKPRTSRDYSSERFLICTGYKNSTIFEPIKESKKIYIKDIFNNSKFSHNNHQDLYKDLLYSNELLSNRNNICLKKIIIDTKKNTLATEFLNAFYEKDKYTICKHKIQDNSSDMILCSYCDAVVIL